jgi:WD40 repeat protein
MVAFGPDSRMLAFSALRGDNGNIRLWHIGNRRRIASLSTYGLYSFVAFASDGKTLLWTDSTIRASDGGSRAVAGMSIKRWNFLSGHSSPIVSIYPTRDGYTVQSPLSEETTGGEEVHPFFVSAEFSRDGEMLAARDENGRIVVVGMAKHEILGVFSHDAGIYDHAVTISPNNRFLAAGGKNTIKFWDLVTNAKTVTIHGNNREVSALAFSPEGRLLASYGHTNSVVLWNVATGESIASVRTRSIDVTAVAFSPTGETLATAGREGEIELWNVAKLQQAEGNSGNAK